MTLLRPKGYPLPPPLPMLRSPSAGEGSPRPGCSCAPGKPAWMGSSFDHSGVVAQHNEGIKLQKVAIGLSFIGLLFAARSGR
jgi:hypothetical protein